MATILELKNITKSYPGVMALKNVSISFEKGEVHAIVGENGAGKSTLIKTLAGAITADSGEIVISGNRYDNLTPRFAKECGVEVIYQEFNLVDSLSVAENIFLGEKFGTFVDYRLIEKKAKAIFEEFGVDIDPSRPVAELTPAHMQIVEISKAVSKKVSILVMDEPTAPLTVTEVEALFRMIDKLKKQGVTILYISHRLDEIFAISDRVSVLRDGEYICTKNIEDTHRQDLIGLMVGRKINNIYAKENLSEDSVVLRVENMTGNGVHDISFELKKGEILGVSGLVGSGRTELVRLICGADKKEKGIVYLNGQEVSIRSPKEALAKGIGLIPEDRKHDGCFLDMSIRWNISVAVLRKISKKGFVLQKEEQKLGNLYQENLKIKTPSLEQKVGNLSGGNQQKVVLAKVLACETEVIIFDEPTRGIDIGAREEIYHLMIELVKAGKSIIMITSDMEELLGMSDRIIVISEGHLAGEILRPDFDQRKVLEIASTYEGGKKVL